MADHGPLGELARLVLAIVAAGALCLGLAFGISHLLLTLIGGWTAHG